MLLTGEQMKHLNKGATDDTFVFLDDDTVTETERQWLKDMDNFVLNNMGYHFIDNYQDLYKTAAPDVRRVAFA